MGILVETPLPSEIHGPTLAALITNSVVLKTAVLKEKKMVFQGPHMKRLEAINHTQEENQLQKWEKVIILLTKEPRMCVIQAKMIFFKSGSYELEMIFTKGKDDGNSIVTVAGSISGSKNEEAISLELSQKNQNQTHREEAAPSFLFFF